MGFRVTHLHGASDLNPSFDEVEALLDELANADEEHTDVSVSDDSGWTLSIFCGGYVIWGNAEDGSDDRHMKGLQRAEILALAKAIARGELDAVHRLPWKSGY
jgi:hypothetical protein